MRSEIERWLVAFAAAVRARDYAAGAALFTRDVLGFGTVTDRAPGLDVLISEQWRRIWESTRDFDFDYATLRAEVAAESAWAAVMWWSSPADGAASPAKRKGRATLVFERHETTWLAVHTHFSLCSEAPA